MPQIIILIHRLFFLVEQVPFLIRDHRDPLVQFVRLPLTESFSLVVISHHGPVERQFYFAGYSAVVKFFLLNPVER